MRKVVHSYVEDRKSDRSYSIKGDLKMSDFVNHGAKIERSTTVDLPDDEAAAACG